MKRIMAPQVITLDGELLHITGERVEQVPETPSGDGIHFDSGQARTSPCADSCSASLKRESSLTS